jgi:predicted Zn-dependent protease
VETGTVRAARVEQAGKRIAAVAGRPDFQWAFHTIDKPVLNAFCLPGGRVFVYTGLLEFTEGNDAELAAVIGHEIAHVIARHGAERVSQAQATSLGGTLLGLGVSVVTGSSATGQTAQRGYSALTQLGILLPFSRSQETEADHIGTILAAKAGYDPRAAITFWEKLLKQSEGGRPPAFLAAFLSTHPLSETRIADLRRMMPDALKYYDPLARTH